MIHVNISKISRCPFLTRKKLKKMVAFILRRLDVTDGELSIVFASDAEIAKLNRVYRKKNVPTDVLSFSMLEGKRLKNESAVLGDIVISVDRAKAQAKTFGTAFKMEMELYIIHGILHLFGYDDEEPKAQKRMRRKERELLALLNNKF